MKERVMPVEMPVVFPGASGLLSGLFVRDTADLSVRRIGVMITGSWLTVKEQMALLYARRLAGLGYTAFVFDFSGFGQSEGELRQAEIPAAKIADLHAAADFLSTLSFVVPERIGHVAICASAQYAQHAIAQGARVAALASIAGWYHDATSLKAVYGGDEGIARRLEFASQDVEALLARQGRVLAPAYAPGDEHAGMPVELDYYSRPERGAIPAWKNEMAPLSWMHWLAFDGISVSVRNTVPTLMVHGPGCALPDNARRVYDALPGPKRLVWQDGQQIDYYDQPEQVDRSVAEIDTWFRQYLGA